MTRLQQCIDALEADMLHKPNDSAAIYNTAIREAISIITTILSAEPGGGEIENVGLAIHRAAFGELTCIPNESDKKYAIAALITMFGKE